MLPQSVHLGPIFKAKAAFDNDSSLSNLLAL